MEGRGREHDVDSNNKHFSRQGEPFKWMEMAILKIKSDIMKREGYWDFA